MLADDAPRLAPRANGYRFAHPPPRPALSRRRPGAVERRGAVDARVPGVLLRHARVRVHGVERAARLAAAGVRGGGGVDPAGAAARPGRGAGLGVPLAAVLPEPPVPLHRVRPPLAARAGAPAAGRPAAVHARAGGPAVVRRDARP